MFRHSEWRVEYDTEVTSGVRWSNCYIRRAASETLESCRGRPISKNSVLNWLSERRLADIKAETVSIVACRWETFCEKSGAEKETNSWLYHIFQTIKQPNSNSYVEIQLGVLSPPPWVCMGVKYPDVWPCIYTFHMQESVIYISRKASLNCMIFIYIND